VQKRANCFCQWTKPSCTSAGSGCKQTNRTKILLCEDQ